MRLIVILISLVIIVFMFFIYVNKSLAPVPESLNLEEDINISQDDTIFDTIDYAKDASDQAILQTCLRLCVGNADNIEDCQAECRK